LKKENEETPDIPPGSDIARKLALIYRVQHYLLDDCGPLTEVFNPISFLAINSTLTVHNT